MDNPAVFHHYLALAAPYIKEYGYLAVLVGVLVESFGIPAPGQSLVIAGALLASQGEMHIALLLLAAWSAAVIGDNIGYAIGHFGGRRLVLRHGCFVGVRAARLQRVEQFFSRYGGGVVLVARFFEVLRQLNGVVAGTAGMPWWRFFAFNALGALLWVSVWGLGVYHLGENMNRVFVLFKRVEPYAAVLGLTGLIALLIFLFRHRVSQPPES